jgi:hypothetical protein
MTLDLGRVCADYERQGWAVLPGLFSAAEAAQMRTWADELAALAPRSGSVWHYSDDEARARGEPILSRIEYLRPHHAGLGSVLEDARIQTVLAALFGEPALLFKDKINYKYPGSAGFELHQDAQAGWGTYGPVHVTVMVSMDPTTLANGCLELALGPRRSALCGPVFAPLRAQELPGIALSALITAPGDAVLFDSFVPHRSAPNTTPEPRRVLYATYNPRSHGDSYERYFADKHRSYPPDVDRRPERAYRYRV